MSLSHARTAFFAALAALAMSVAPVQPAHATTVAPLTVEQFTDASTWIIRGEVLEVWTELADSGRVWTRARVKVNDVLKGPSRPEELIIDSLGGTYGDVVTVVPGQALYSEGEDLVAFLHEDGGRLSPVAKFLGKYTVRRAPDTRQYHVMQWAAVEGVPFDHRFLPHPAPQDRILLDTFMDQVRRRLEAGWDGQPIPGVSPENLRTINTPERRMPR